MDEFIDKHLATIITALLGVLAWANEKRNKRAQVQRLEGETFKLMQIAYETFAKDTNEKYIELKAELSLVRKELAEQKKENTKLRAEISYLKTGVNLTSGKGINKKKGKK